VIVGFRLEAPRPQNLRRLRELDIAVVDDLTVGLEKSERALDELRVKGIG
jgi:hypothetical protein